MGMWEALPYVGTGLSLVAFAVAAILLAYRARLAQRAEIIRSAPEQERLEAIATTAEFFRVDVSALTRAQQQDIALTQIRARARRDLLLAGVSSVVAILLAAIAIAAISKPAVNNEEQVFKQIVGLPLEEQIKKLQAISDAQKAGPQQKSDYVEAILYVTRKQLRAVQLLDAGEPDQAVVELDSAENELNRIPTGSAPARNQRGYTYKTFAEAFLKKGDDVQAKRYLDKALNIFEQVTDDPNAAKQELARAIHGIGNIKALRGDSKAAIADYDHAILLFPSTPYAWYDRFLAYDDLAKHREFDQAAMRESLNRTQKIDILTPQEIAALEAILRRRASENGLR
jgi:tetratricopeptide (TPR) repeat protein